MPEQVLKNLTLTDEMTTHYTTIRVYLTEDGRTMLTMDKFIQFVEGEDERIFHDNLTRHAYTIHGYPEDILILGGGDGLAARNLYRHSPMLNITLVDIDGVMIEYCRTDDKMKEMNEGSLDKCNVIIDDALKFVPKCKDKYDIVICDFPDPNCTILEKLYTKEFLKKIVGLLKDAGVFCMQCHYTITSDIGKKIKDILGNSREIEFEMPFLETGSVVLGVKENA